MSDPVAARRALLVSRWSDRQDPPDRLDTIGSAVMVNERDHRLNGPTKSDGSTSGHTDKPVSMRKKETARRAANPPSPICVTASPGCTAQIGRSSPAASTRGGRHPNALPCRPPGPQADSWIFSREMPFAMHAHASKAAGPEPAGTDGRGVQRRAH